MSESVPVEWKINSLSEVSNVNWGNTSITKSSYTPHGFHAFSASGRDGHLPFCENETKGIVLSAIGARCGLTFKTPKFWTAIKNTITILPKEKTDVDFLYFSLNYGEVWNKSGGAQPFISLGDAKKTILKIPPLPEQQKIASILTSVDEVIEKIQSQINKLQDLKKATMNELLTRGIGHTEFKDSPVGRIPKEWEVKRLDKIVSVVDSLHETPSFSEQGIPMIRVGDIKGGEINTENCVKVDFETYKKFIKKYEPKKNDLLMSRVGTYGICSYINSDTKLCLGQNTVIIISKNINSRFIYYLINSIIIQKQIELEVEGSGYKSLSLENIRSLIMVLPTNNEINLITSSLIRIDTNISSNQKKLSCYKNLKKSLMQDLLTGKVRVTVN